MKHCNFYQAELDRARIWFFVATMRSFEHLAFDRAFDPKENKFEFLVPQGNVALFEELIKYYLKIGLVLKITKLENRFLAQKS